MVSGKGLKKRRVNAINNKGRLWRLLEKNVRLPVILILRLLCVTAY